jgi:PGF-pre-PGF domain-containing protein
MTIYANDTVGNIGYTAVTFNINDTASPIINISSLSPQGTIPYATSEVLFLTTDENATCRYGASNVSYDSMIGTFSDNLTQHIKTVSVAEGENDFYIRCRDMSNNTNVDSTLLNFVVESHPSPPSGGSTGGGGGTGGSGGWGGSGGYDTTGDYVAQTIDSMDAGVTNVDVNKRGIPVSRVTFNTSRNLTDVMITINKTTTPEKNYTEDVVLAYLLLEQKNLPMDALISLDIYFSVNRTWLKENNLSKEEIILLEYFRPNDTWNPLHTEYVNEDEDNIYYISRSTGPGLYAISTNHTHDLGTPIIQEPETPKANKTANASVTSYVNSGAGSGNSKLSAVIKDIVNAVKTQKELIWIVLALIITFAVVVTSMLLVKRHAVKSASQYDVVKQYEEGLISGTKEEFKQSEKVLTKKVPAVPEDIEAELSKMVDKKFSEAKSQDKKTIESNKKNKTLKK